MRGRILTALGAVCALLAFSGADGHAQSSKKAAAAARANSPEAAANRRATELEQQALALEQQNRFQEAEPLYAEIARLRREALGPRHPDAIIALSNYAYILQVLGRFGEAEPLYAQLVTLSSEVLGERDQNTLIFMANHGRSLMTLGRVDEAEPVLARALQLFREELGNRHPGTLTALNFYASALEALGRVREAEPLYAEVLQLRRKTLGNRHPDTIEAQSNYALALMKLDRAADAEPVMAAALEASRAVLGNRHFTTISLIGNYGAILELVERPAEAEPLYREALQLQRDVLGERHPTTLIGINNLANSLKNLGRYSQSERLMAESVQLHEAVLGPRHPSTIAAKGNHAKTLVLTRQWPAAIARMRELTAIMRSRAADLSGQGVRGSAQRDREFADRQGFEKFLANVLWGNRFEPGMERQALAEEAFTALQLASAGSTSRAVREAAASRFASQRGLAEQVEERQARVREWLSVEASLIANEAGGAANSQAREALRARITALEGRIFQLDQQLADGAPQFFAILSQQAVSLDTLRSVLGEEEAVLFLVPTPYGTQSMAVTRETISWDVASLTDTSIAESVSLLREGLEVQPDSPFLPLFDLARSHALYTQLIAPVEEALSGKSRVFVVADGALSRLPLGTLTTQAPDADEPTDDPDILRGASWLADRYALVQLPSLQSLVYIRTYSAASGSGTEMGFAGFGAPVLGSEAALRSARSATLPAYDAARLVGGVRGMAGAPLMNPNALRRLSALPGTRVELEQVREALGAPQNALYLAEDMTETAVRRADLSRTGILHFATHGFTSEESGDAAEPGLVFTPPGKASATNDGYLAASEVVALNLASARWVILSACNTASPSGSPGETGLSGLAQAFFYAGAESLLVSHWPVFDDIAPVLTVKTLMRSQSGEPRAEALREAMREIRQDPAYDAAHPAVWAPFTLVGEGR